MLANLSTSLTALDGGVPGVAPQQRTCSASSGSPTRLVSTDVTLD